MFKRWFKPKWEHEQPEMRCLAIAALKLDKPNHQDILKKLALEDTSEAVRLAAAERITDAAMLVQMLNRSASERERQTLSPRILGLALGRQELGQQELDQEPRSWQKRRAVLDDVVDVTVFRDCLKSTYPESLLTYILDRWPDDQAFFSELVQNADSRHVRQQAALRLESPLYLKQALAAAKAKDKTVYRIVKQKLDVLKRQGRAETQQREEVATILREMERLQSLEADSLLPHKIKQFESRWAALDIDLSEWSDRYREQQAALNAKCASVAEQQHEQAQRVIDQAEASKTLVSVCDAVEEALRVAAQEFAVKAVDTLSLKRACETQRTRWQQACALDQPSAELQARWQTLMQHVADYCAAIDVLRQNYDRVAKWIDELAELKSTHRDDIQRLLKRFSAVAERIHWPAQLNRPTVLTLIEDGVKQTKRLLSESSKAIADLERDLARHIDTLERAIAEGLLKEGQAALRDVHLVLRELPIGHSERHQKKLRGLMQSLNELRDWQGFATIPKKTALLEKMKALIEENIAPVDRAERVKALQQAWRELGNVQSQEEKTLWVAFKAASEAAFAPCKDYFDSLQAQRDENAKQREVILTQLETYAREHDWANADWNLVVETLKVARAQWRAASPVDRRVHIKMQRRFDRVVADIQSHVDAERDRNAMRKAKMVEQAAELLDHDDVEAAIKTMKALQADWKTIGITQREAEQKLWAELQKHANALFGQRRRRWEDQNAERAANRDRVLALTQSIQQVVEADADPIEALERVQAWREEFEQIAPLPQEDAKQLRQGFRQAYRRFEAACAEAQSQRAERDFACLRWASSLLDQFERDVSLGEVSSQQLEVLKSQWQTLGHLPEGAEVGLNARFDTAIAAGAAMSPEHEKHEMTPYDQKSILARRRDTLLQLEILLGLDSPADEQQQRLTLQVDRLSSKLGGKATDGDAREAAESLIIQWCVSSNLGLLPDIDPLQARFEQAYREWLSLRKKESPALRRTAAGDVVTS